MNYTPTGSGAVGFVYEQTERNGSITRFTRDARGLVLTKTEDATGTAPRVTSYTWHSTLRLPLTRTTSQMRETFTYDAGGLLLTYTQTDVLAGSPSNGQSRTWTYTYTALASGLKVLSSINGPGTGTVNDVTTFTYSADGRLSTVTDPNRIAVQILAYDALARPSSVRDGQGFTWALSYDVEGRLTQAVFATGTPAAETLRFTYDAAGQMLTSTDARGRVWTYTYDTARRLTAIRAPGGERAEYSHDAMGNAIQTRYFTPGSVQTYLADSQFDELGRVLKLLGSNTQTMAFAHDVEDNLIRETDALNFVTSYSYDALNRMTRMVDEASFASVTSYNDSDLPTVFRDPRNLDTVTTYNGFGEVIREVSPDRGTRTYVYDSRGLVIRMTDPRGIVTVVTYDNGGRVATRSYPSQPALNQVFTYWADATQRFSLGQLRFLTDQAGRTVYTYSSANGQLTRERREIGVAGYNVDYAWNVRGEVSQMTYPSGARLFFSYDANGNLSRLEWQGINPTTGALLTRRDVVSSITWRPFGPLAGMTYGDTGTLVVTHDSSYRVSRLHDVRGAVTLRDITYSWTDRDDLAAATNTLTGTPGSGTLSDWQRSFDVDGRLTQSAMAPTFAQAETQSFTYDARQMLIRSDGPWGALRWTYDGVGNRTSQTLTTTDTYVYPGTSNRLASITLGAGGSRAMTYDAAGNVTRDARTGTDHGYTYDAAGRMASYSLNGILQAEYQYSAAGQQVVRRLLPSGEQIHAVHDAAGQRIAEYLFTPATGASTLIREYIWAAGQAVGVVEGGQLFFVRTDHIGRPVFATNDAGQVVWSATYHPFGGVRVTQGTPIGLRFPGQWFQAESGLQQNWMRDYDPVTGRYIQPDPLGLIDGPGVYGYALQSPMVWTDPRGEWAMLAGAAAGAVIGGVAGYIQTGCWQGVMIGAVWGAGIGTIPTSGFWSLFLVGGGEAFSGQLLPYLALNNLPDHWKCGCKPQTWSWRQVTAVTAGASLGGPLGGFVGRGFGGFGRNAAGGGWFGDFRNSFFEGLGGMGGEFVGNEISGGSQRSP